MYVKKANFEKKCDLEPIYHTNHTIYVQYTQLWKCNMCRWIFFPLVENTRQRVITGQKRMLSVWLLWYSGPDGEELHKLLTVGRNVFVEGANRTMYGRRREKGVVLNKLQKCLTFIICIIYVYIGEERNEAIS